ncbi:MAG: LPS export ABC transporter periplasmic protein LptC [bacterium]|nr:LPS export ABC transporter periplasmic protein LptC [bacterium]
MMRTICLLLLMALLAGCSGEEEPATSSRPAGVIPEQQFYDYVLIESDAGVRHWVLESDEMQKFAGERDVLLVTVRMEFYREGEYFSTLTSDSGRADLQSKNVHTWGNVVVLTEDGRKLETEELFFDNESQLITNDVFDRFTNDDDDVVTGIGLEATPDLEYIEIKQDPRGTIHDAAGEGGGS